MPRASSPPGSTLEINQARGARLGHEGRGTLRVKLCFVISFLINFKLRTSSSSNYSIFISSSFLFLKMNFILFVHFTILYI